MKLNGLTPGTVLNPGTAPVAAKAVLPTTGPLKGVLVAAQSQKASGTGAVGSDTALPTGTVLYTIKLDLLDTAAPGVVFDGSAGGFALKSGGLRNKAGTAVVNPSEVGIGKLETRRVVVALRLAVVGLLALFGRDSRDGGAGRIAVDDGRARRRRRR